LEQHKFDKKLILFSRHRETEHSGTEKTIPRTRHHSKTRQAGNGELLAAAMGTRPKELLS